MAEPVDLDPGDYGGTYKFNGGSPALDFANLVSYRDTAREHDWLTPATNAQAWVDAAGLKVRIAASPATLRTIRELIAHIFLAIADNTEPADQDLADLTAMANQTRAHQQLTWNDHSRVATWTHPSPTLVDIIVDDATRLLTSTDILARIEACHDCRWLFWDTTRNHSRRWCDPADCGNRARQRRHYHRHN